MTFIKERMLLAFVAALMSMGVCAQNGFTASVEADLVSHYMWRGSDIGGISIQPTFSLGWNGLSLSAFGNAGFDSSDVKEIDLMLGYENSGFSVAVTDYWVSGKDPNDRYFFYEKNGAHQLEATLGYQCKYFSLTANTIFWGDDFKVNGERAYSTYIEANVPFELGGVNWTISAGMCPFQSAGYLEEKEREILLGTETYEVPHFFYAEGAACVRASVRATKELDLGFSQIPVFAEFHANPYLQTAQMVFGVTIKPFK